MPKDFVSYCEKLTVKENVLTDHLYLKLCVHCSIAEAQVKDVQINRIVRDTERVKEFGKALVGNFEASGLPERIILDEINIDTVVGIFYECFIQIVNPVKMYFQIGKNKNGAIMV